MSPVYSFPLHLTHPLSTPVALIPPFTPPLQSSILLIHIPGSSGVREIGSRSGEVSTVRYPQAGSFQVRETGSRPRELTTVRSPQTGSSRVTKGPCVISKRILCHLIEDPMLSPRGSCVISKMILCHLQDDPVSSPRGFMCHLQENSLSSPR